MSADARTRPARFARTLHDAGRTAATAAVPDAAAIRAGLPLERLDALVAATGLSAEAAGHLLDVSPRTLQRRRAAGERLSSAESDRLWRLLHVLRLATRAFGSEDAARTWLTAPKALLAGETPLERLDTEPGLREVEDMLTVIDETAAA